MEKVLTITAKEARSILDTMDNLEGEFAGCYPSGGECDEEHDQLSVDCTLCRKIRIFLSEKGKEE